MSNRLLTLLIFLVSISMGALVILNYSGIQLNSYSEKFLSPNNVKAIEVFSQGKPYPLNFEQQNRAVQLLNRTILIGLETYFESEEAEFDYDRVVIIPFEGEPIELTPVGFMNQQLVLKAPAWNPKGLIREMGTGELHPLFNQSFDR